MCRLFIVNILLNFLIINEKIPGLQSRLAVLNLGSNCPLVHSLVNIVELSRVNWLLHEYVILSPDRYCVLTGV